MRLFGARRAIHDATAIHWLKGEGLRRELYGCKIDRSPSSSADRIIVDGLEAGRILAAVDAQSEPVRMWLYLAYGVEAPAHYRGCLVEELWRDLFQAKAAHRWPRLRRLAGAAIDDYRLRVLQGRELPLVALCYSVGADPAHWWRDGWGRRLRLVQERLNAWDGEGLRAVAAVIGELVEEEA